MIFVKTFKGYEDKVQQLDDDLNSWVAANKVDVRGVETALSHEDDSRAASGDLIYTVLYKADAPIA